VLLSKMLDVGLDAYSAKATRVEYTRGAQPEITPGSADEVSGAEAG
jgi:hypothetical protein